MGGSAGELAGVQPAARSRRGVRYTTKIIADTLHILVSRRAGTRPPSQSASREMDLWEKNPRREPDALALIGSRDDYPRRQQRYAAAPYRQGNRRRRGTALLGAEALQYKPSWIPSRNKARQ